MQKKSTINDLPAGVLDCPGVGLMNVKAGVLYNIMRVTLIQITVAMIFSGVSIAFENHAQEILKRKVSLELKDISLMQALSEIEKAAKVKFVYSPARINLDEKISVSVSKYKLGALLSALLTPRSINFKVQEDNNYIVLVENGKVDFQSFLMEDGAKITPVSVSGMVSDSKGNAIPGANILVKGTTNGTTTDAEGRYSLAVLEDNALLVFSFIGYASQEVAVNGRSLIDVVLIEDVQNLEEVVVVGYGEQKKATITGAISSVSGEKLMASPSINYTGSLAGRLPGLTVVSSSGEPGRDNALLRIRGSNTLGDNSPLIVVDGIQNRDINRLNPSDIESITILKDASAAIYGVQAANGVILVTTKRGKVGKPTITVSLNQGWSMPTVLPEMADAGTFAQMSNEIDFYRGQPATYTPEEIQKYKDGSDPWLYPNTDWLDLVIKPSSLQNKGDISINGGSEKVKFFISSGFNYQDGIYRNSVNNYSQADFRSNINAEISKNIQLSVDVAGRQENRNFPSLETNRIFASLISGGAGSGGRPNIVAFYPGNKPGGGFIQGMNPVVMGTEAAGYDKSKTYTFLSNIKLQVTIPWVKGLSITGNAAFDKNWYDRKLWLIPWDLYNWDRATYDSNNEPVVTPSKSGWALDPQLTQDMSNGRSTTLNAMINYDFSLAEIHHVKILAGTEKTTGASQSLMAYRRGFISTAIPEMFAGADPNKNNGGSATQSARLTYMGRLNYNFDEKYLLEFVFRYDGSYIFPEKGRFGFFPGVSAGWIISEENFWKNNLASFNYFKIRGSSGRTGNDRITPYQYLSTYGFGNDPLVLNTNVETKTLVPLRIPNPNITWEIAHQSNIGFDAQMFDGKIDFSADYFYNLRTNILWYRNASVPSSAGFSLPPENIGEVANRGFEAQVTYNKQTGNFHYSVSVNGAYSQNKIKFWDETPGIPDYQLSTGRPMDAGLYYNAIGIFKDQAAVDAYPHWAGARAGDIIFEDVNGDDKIDGLDRIRFDKTFIPTFSGGMTIDLQYKNFFASILLQGSTGAVRTADIWSGKDQNFLAEHTEGRWTVENTNASKPRAWNLTGEYWSTGINNTYWLRNNDYVRLKNFQLGYNFSGAVIDRLGIKGLGVSFTGLNLLTLSKEKSFDPETVGNTYPMSKVYNLGVNLTF
jgi:TonB-dependent starch-binding outer membrane protein SusC